MKTPAEKFGGGPIVIAEYNSAWPMMFEREREVVGEALGKLVLEIEHIGSTAIPGLPAKPIIDLLVGIRSLAEARSRAVEPLVQRGYVYIPEYEPWLPDELFFRKGVPGPWTHHVHVMEPGNPRWDDHLRFRDYLRGHPATAAAYAELKKTLAQRFRENIGAYRDAKDKFVRDVLVRARAADNGGTTRP
ncbi:MAG: GrpB family protein [Xanthobacteraceae bacterium]